ncbi:MAG: hypothetical protein J7K23_02110, partial [Thermoproteales archaeon]|nr:hypothetical protein [Thermoproteales archaeon]
MVLASKIFYLSEKIGLNTIAAKIKNFKILDIQEINGKEYEVGSSISSLEKIENGLRGKYEESFILNFKYHDEDMLVPITVITPFEFIEKENITYIIIFAKKNRANRVANFFSTILTAEKNKILEIEISHKTLQKIVEERKEYVKVIFFDNVKIPGINKLSLYGRNILDTQQYEEYIKIGKIWYVVLEFSDDIVIGLTRNGIVTFFSKIIEEDAFKFIEEKILPLSQV